MSKAAAAARGNLMVPGEFSRKKGVEKEISGKSWSVRVVDSGMQGDKLVVTLEGDSVEQLLGQAARQLAYQQRLEWGMAHAGIEASGGTYIDEKEAASAKKEGRNIGKWRIDFVMTPGL